MPIFEYRCEECGAIFELLVMSEEDAREPRCRRCDATEVKKVLSATAVRITTQAAGGFPGAPAGGCGSGGFS
ncbi:MAG: zinc ribbon domain-containing protein [Thermodesulfobacteriota bacterium]